MAVFGKWRKHVPNWTSCIVLVSQITALGGVVGAVYLLLRLSDPAPAPLAQSSFASAENWTEIENGVPDATRPIGLSDQLSALPQKPIGSPIERSQRAVSTTLATLPAEASVPGSVPIVSDAVEPARVDNAAPGPPDGQALATAPAVAADTDEPVTPQGSSEAGARVSNSNQEPGDTGSVASSTTSKPEEAKTGAQANKKANAEPGLVASPPQVRTRDGTSVSKREDEAAALEPERPKKAPQAAARARQSSTAKPRPGTGTAEVQPRKKKPVSGQRTRTAAAQPRERLERGQSAPPGPEAAQPVQDERVRFLGIPLPTGSEVKQCLFEFRC